MGFFPPLLISTYANFAAFPASTADGQVGIALDTDNLYIYNLATTTWKLSGGPGFTLTLGALDGGSSGALGASIVADVLYMQSASGTVPGLVNTTTQTFAGAKTFSSAVKITANINQLVLGTTNTFTVTMATLAASFTLTLPAANCNPIQPIGSATANNWVQYIDSNGVQNLAQPSISNILGLGANVATFLATPSSANLASALTDKTGTGVNVFATSPTLVTPVLGVASATSINKYTFTAPASAATLTIADGKTLTLSNTLTFTGTDSSSVAFGAGGTVLYSGGALGTPSSANLTHASNYPFVAPTIQKFTSSTGTYTTPTSPAPLYIRVQLVGGGGGGAGGGSTGGAGGAGGTGGNTTFGTTLLVGNGGVGGASSTTHPIGGIGGTASLGSGPIGNAISGSMGNASFILGAVPQSGTLGGSGGSSPFGGAGGGASDSSGVGSNGIANSGSGGGGGSTGAGATQMGGGGGGSGGYVDAIISSPSATYAYAVGGAGAAGTATAGGNGGSGGSGFIIVTEYYQ